MVVNHDILTSIALIVPHFLPKIIGHHVIECLFWECSSFHGDKNDGKLEVVRLIFSKLVSTPRFFFLKHRGLLSA